MIISQKKTTGLAFILAIVLSGCSEPPVGPGYLPGEKQVFAGDGVSFNLVCVPGCSFPIGTDDSGTATVTNDFWIGETEVPYTLWRTVCLWATDVVRPTPYYFQNSGSLGSANTGDFRQPVTMVNWRDAVVWCNAATEWYNAMNGTSLACVYRDSGTNQVIRDSRDANGAQCDAVGPDPEADGFRLPSRDEFQLAARWKNDAANSVPGYANPYFTQGDSASGATADYNASTATRLVAVYLDNSAGKTAAVKSRVPNDLGLYDMSGNTYEWCFDISNRETNTRNCWGGAWQATSDHMQVGRGSSRAADTGAVFVGFRIARWL